MITLKYLAYRKPNKQFKILFSDVYTLKPTKLSWIKRLNKKISKSYSYFIIVFWLFVLCMGKLIASLFGI